MQDALEFEFPPHDGVDLPDSLDFVIMREATGLGFGTRVDINMDFKLSEAAPSGATHVTTCVTMTGQACHLALRYSFIAISKCPSCCSTLTYSGKMQDAEGLHSFVVACLSLMPSKID